MSFIESLVNSLNLPLVLRDASNNIAANQLTVTKLIADEIKGVLSLDSKLGPLDVSAVVDATNHVLGAMSGGRTLLTIGEDGALDVETIGETSVADLEHATELVLEAVSEEGESLATLNADDEFVGKLGAEAMIGETSVANLEQAVEKVLEATAEDKSLATLNADDEFVGTLGAGAMLGETSVADLESAVEKVLEATADEQSLATLNADDEFVGKLGGEATLGDDDMPVSDLLEKLDSAVLKDEDDGIACASVASGTNYLFESSEAEGTVTVKNASDADAEVSYVVSGTPSRGTITLSVAADLVTSVASNGVAKVLVTLPAVDDAVAAFAMLQVNRLSYANGTLELVPVYDPESKLHLHTDLVLNAGGSLALSLAKPLVMLYDIAYSKAAAEAPVDPVVPAAP